MSKQIETLKSLNFGTELEYTGISREKAARAIHRVVGGQVSENYNNDWEVRAADGRVWKAVYDGSLRGSNSAEVVTPILKYDDLDTLQKVVRELRHAGAKATSETSQHVHVGVESLDARQLANLVRIFYKQEELILKAVGTWEHRLGHYTKRTDRAFIQRLEAMKPQTRAQLNEAWYGSTTRNHSARYRALNLNNVTGTGTVEFRIFNGTTHAGEVKAHVTLCLAIAALAKNAKAASSKNQRPYSTASAKYDARVFYLRIGLVGEEFKNTRMHLMKRLPGSAAWKNGRS